MTVSLSELLPLQILTADCTQVFDYPLFLSKPETHKATHDLLHHLSSLVPTLYLPLEEEQKLAILISAVLEERKGLKLKTVDMALRVTASREQIALVKKEQMNGAKGDEKKDRARQKEHMATRDSPEKKSDFVPGVDTIGGQAAWMRLL